MPSCAQLCTRRPRTVLLKLLPRKVASFLVAATALKQKLKDRRGQPLAGGESTHVPHIVNRASRNLPSPTRHQAHHPAPFSYPNTLGQQVPRLCARFPSVLLVLAFACFY